MQENLLPQEQLLLQALQWYGKSKQLQISLLITQKLIHYADALDHVFLDIVIMGYF